MRLRHIYSGTEYAARLIWPAEAEYPVVLAAGIAEPIDSLGFIVLEATAAERMVLSPEWRRTVVKVAPCDHRLSTVGVAVEPAVMR